MALNDYVQQLTKIGLFKSMTMEAVRLIAFSAEARILRPGDVLFQEGEAADGGYVVLSGALALTRADTNAQLVGPGALIGEMALITEMERYATATAQEVTGVLRISRSLFHRILQEFPDSAAGLQAEFAERLREVSENLDKFHGRFAAA